MKKRISIILIVAIVLCTLPISVSAHDEEKTGGEILKDIYVTAEKQMPTEIAEPPVDSSTLMTAQYVSSTLSESRDYADNYGGTFIDDNTVVVLMCGDTEQAEAYCSEIVGKTAVEYQICQYSFDYLTSLSESILSFYKANYNTANIELSDLLTSIVSVGIYEEENAVCVEILNCNDELIDTFKTYISNSDAIIFEKAIAVAEDATITVSPGELIYMDPDPTDEYWSIYSMGFRCWLMDTNGNYIYGFVTAGHGNSVNDPVYASDGVQIGYVYDRVLSGNADAAFVAVTNSNYTCTNDVFYGSDVLEDRYYMTSYTTGLEVFKAGQTTGLTDGKIKSTSASLTADGVTIDDLVKANYEADGGDSGGIVYIHMTDHYSVAGIHRGRSTVLWIEYSYFVKVTNIKNALGVILY